MRRKVLFLDRDGVINIDSGYVHRVEDFYFIDEIFDICLWAVRSGLEIIVITNQSGIGRGYYSESSFLELSAWMKKQFADRGIPILAIYYCPYHPKYGIGKYKYKSPDRKPAPGMFLRAKLDFLIDMQGSVMIGDHVSDLMASYKAGVGCNLLLSKNMLLGLLSLFGIRRFSSLKLVLQYLKNQNYSDVKKIEMAV
jgi:D-glycero-D-manno-heptose 1,7-bisphosphate phosphatase